MKLRLNAMLMLALAATVLVGCGDDDDSDHEPGDHDHKGDAGSAKDAGGAVEKLEVAGTWSSEFGDNKISLKDWDGAAVVAFDNDDNTAITHTPDDAEFNPDTYSKLVWTEPTDEGFFYCTVDFGLKSRAAAEETEKTADDSDPEMGGCGMFPWTKLEPL